MSLMCSLTNIHIYQEGFEIKSGENSAYLLFTSWMKEAFLYPWQQKYVNTSQICSIKQQEVTAISVEMIDNPKKMKIICSKLYDFWQLKICNFQIHVSSFSMTQMYWFPCIRKRLMKLFYFQLNRSPIYAVNVGGTQNVINGR